VSKRTDLVARLPWVTRLEETTSCDGYRWSAMSFRARRDPELMAKYKCRAPARWKFRALKRNLMFSQDGTYCWSHLWAMGLQHDMTEEARTWRGLARMVSVDEWNAL
jgi:hypothetical protein